MNKLWKKTQQSEGGQALEQVVPGALTLDKPTVVFFSGLFTTGKGINLVKGAAGHIEEMLGGAGNNISDHADIRVWQYKSKRSNLKNIFNYNCFPSRAFSRNATIFVGDFLLPLVAENGTYNVKKKSFQGQKKDFKDVEKAFNNLTFMAYSYGSVFSQEVYNGAKKMMKQVGFSKNQTRLLLSRIHLISMGAVSRPMKEKNRFTSITLVATNDRISNHKNKIWWSVKEFFARAARKLTIRRLTKRNAYITAPVQKDLFTPHEDKEGQVVMRNIRKLFPAWWPRHSYHELQHYTTDRDFDNEFSKIARFALLNAMQRDKPLTLEQMIAPANPIVGEGRYSPDEKAVYETRISAAMQPLKNAKT